MLGINKSQAVCIDHQQLKTAINSAFGGKIVFEKDFTLDYFHKPKIYFDILNRSLSTETNSEGLFIYSLEKNSRQKRTFFNVICFFSLGSEISSSEKERLHLLFY
jgi:hypothetical protein